MTTEKATEATEAKREVPKDAREVYCNEAGDPIAFCPKDGIGITDFQRHQFFMMNKERCRELEARAESKTDPSVVICIDVEDKSWTPLVELLMPRHDWDQYRNRGEHPVARGIVSRLMVTELAAECYPAAGVPPAGVFTAVCAAGGISFVLARESP